MRMLGFVFVSLIIAGIIVAADYLLPGTYLESFLDGHFIETFAALVGFNIAAIVFLMGQLMTLEERYNVVFNKTRKEIKQNSYFLLSAFVTCFLLLILRPDLGDASNKILLTAYYGINIVTLAIFIMAIFAIYEILFAVFALSKEGE